MASRTSSLLFRAYIRFFIKLGQFNFLIGTSTDLGVLVNTKVKQKIICASLKPMYPPVYLSV